MTGFDPDAYLETQSKVTPAFDPDVYLTQASAPSTEGPTGSQHAAKVADIVMRHPFTVMTGLAENTLGGIAGTFADVANAVTRTEPDAPDRYVPANWTQPHTQAGQQLAEAAREETNNLGQFYNKIPGADTPLGQTIKRYGPEALGAVGAVSSVGGLVKGMAGARDPVLWGGKEPPPPAQPSSLSDSPQSMGAAKAAPQVGQASPEIQEAVRRAAQQTGGAVNPEALNRHLEADSLPVKVELTAGQALQDPEQLSFEQNNRLKMPELAQRFNQQNKALAENVTALRDRVGPDVFSTNAVEHGDTLIKAYQDKAAVADADISAKYQALRDAAGGQFPVSAPKLLQNVTKQLNDELLLDHAPKSVMSTLGRLADQDNMTFQNFESLRTNLARTMRSATDGNERAAAGVIRQAMEELPLQPGAADLKPLADAARSAARAQFQALDADPAYKAAVNESVPPDRFVQKYVTGPTATRDGVATMRDNLSHDPVATQTLGVAALDHLRKAAGLNEAGEGNFSQAGFNKNLEALGPRIPSLLDPKTAEDLSTLGNVARYTQFQPRGSAVNNSNTFVAAAAEHAKSALEGAINMKAGGIPVATWARNALGQRSQQAAVQQALRPGAGLEQIPTVSK